MAGNPQDRERLRRFARNLRVARERAGLTQAALAAKLGMDTALYAGYERGTTWPSLHKLRRMCDLLGCPADTLLGTRELAPLRARRPEDVAILRELLCVLRSARPRTVHMASRMVAALARHADAVALMKTDEVRALMKRDDTRRES